jgi:BTB/POZ domain
VPLKVRASYDGQVKEMEKTSHGTWKNVSWPRFHLVSNNTNTKKIIVLGDSTSESSDDDPPCYRPRAVAGPSAANHATFQLILEFKDTSFTDGERQVLAHLSNLLDTQSMADVTFVVKNEKISAHSAIVVSASPVFCAMLEENKFKEGRTKTSRKCFVIFTREKLRSWMKTK